MWHWDYKAVQPVNWKRGQIEYLAVLRDFHLTANERNYRYLNYETGKVDRDKLPAIRSLSWSELVEPNHAGGFHGESYSIDRAWFTPKDDDFDEECRRDEENRKAHHAIIMQQQAESLRLKEEYLRQEKEKKEKEEEKAYQERVRKRELELKELEMKVKAMEAKHRVEINQINKKYDRFHPGTDIIKNKWIVK